MNDNLANIKSDKSHFPNKYSFWYTAFFCYTLTFFIKK